MKWRWPILLLLIFSCHALSWAGDVLIETDRIANASPGRYYAISIGINQYDDEFWPNLRWAATDATNMLAILGKETQYEKIPIALVNQAATLANVRAVMDDVARKVTARDIVVLYLSGHGTLTLDPNGDLMRVAVMRDTKKSDVTGTGLLHGELRVWLDHLRANKKMMIMATCNSGLGKSKLTEDVAQYVRSHKGALVPLADVSEGALILSASARDEAAREDDQLGGDVYTHFLLSAALVSDRNHDGMITAMEAHDQAKEQTWVYTRGKQRPSAEAKFIGDADIPLVGRKKGRGSPVLDAYNEQWSGFRLAVNGRDKGTIPTAMALNDESNVVALYTPTNDQPLASYRVVANRGEAISLDDVLYRRPFVAELRLQSYAWSDPAWEKLTGSAYSNQLELDVGLSSSPWLIGLTLRRQRSESARVRPSLDANTAFSSHPLFLEYGHRISHWNLAVRAEAAYETVNLNVQDAVSGESLAFEDSKWAYGIAVVVGYEILPDLRITGSYGLRDVNWQLGELGALDGRRSAIGLGIQYRFDPTIRPVWGRANEH